MYTFTHREGTITLSDSDDAKDSVSAIDISNEEIEKEE